MSRAKKLSRREAELHTLVTMLQELAAERLCHIRDLYRDRNEILEKLVPHVEKIMAVKIGDAYYFPIIEEQAKYIASMNSALPPFKTTKIGMIDTRRKLIVSYAVAEDVLARLLGTVDNTLVEEFFKNVGRRLAVKAIKSVRERVS